MSGRGRLRWFRLAGVTACLALAVSLSLAAGYARSAGPGYVAAAKAFVAAHTSAQTKWAGPTSGPTCEAGKKIVYISTGENNPIGHLWGVYLKQAATQCGWNYTLLDGKSSPSEWIQDAKQAVALKPDGIVTSADAKTMSQGLSQAAKLGIPIVGLHGTAKPGADPADHLFTNMVSNPKDIGRAMVNWAIADSNGQARIVYLYDAIYAISLIKRSGWQAATKPCTTCKVIKDDNFPISDVPTRMGGEATSYVQNLKPPFYVVAVADYYYDFAVPAFRTSGVTTSQVKLIGADGTTQAYNRIRQGNQFQVVTVPEPIEMQSWQAVDELNRAFHKLPPSGFVQDVHIVTKANVDSAGSKNNQYYPPNGYKQHYLKIWKG